MNISDFTNDFSEALKEAKSVLVFTGAGMSAESGIPVFRGQGGIWNSLKPEELASFSAFLKNPDIVSQWYRHRQEIITETKPNAGHTAIAEMEKYFKNFTVVTQNIDNLHKRAGSTKVLELHGNIERNYCIDCNKFYYNPEIPDKSKALKCSCGGLIRPDVVWFGEMLPQNVYDLAVSVARKCDICFIAGTTASVFPAAYIPIIAKENGALIVEVNIKPSEATAYAHHFFKGKAGEIFPIILDLIKTFV